MNKMLYPHYLHFLQIFESNEKTDVLPPNLSDEDVGGSILSE